MSTKAIPSLDGIRAISVFVVLFAHAGLGHIIPGGFGVTTFFFLSGYLITTLLLVEYRNNQEVNLQHFYIRRFFRLFPPLLLTLSISYLMVNFGTIGGEVSWLGSLSQIFYLANYHAIFHWPGGIPDGTGILWSLAVEEHFYLLFPFIFYFLIKNYGNQKVALVLFILCLTILAWRCMLVFNYESVESRTYYATDTRIDSIIFGCILAVMWNPAYEQTSAKMRWQQFVILAIALVTLIFSFLYRNDAFRETLRYTLQGLALMPIFFLAIKHHENYLFRILNFAWMKKLGVYSYFIYLSHFIVIKFLTENDIIQSVFLLIITTSFICIIYSFVLDRYFDNHFRRLRKAFRSLD